MYKNGIIIGNCNESIDWQTLIDNIDEQGFDYTRIPRRAPEWREKAEKNYSVKRAEVHSLIDKWEAGNFNFDFLVIDEYEIPTTHLVAQAFAKFLNITPYFCYISKLRPGFGIPAHWDIDESEEKWWTIGTPRRFSCFISPPEKGHVFICGDDHLHDLPQGSIYEWNTYKTDHIGVNFGLGSKYLFNMLGFSQS